MAVIQGSNITKYFGSELIFKGLNFSVNEKERVAIVGPNGCGKSTLIKMIIGEESISTNPANEQPGEISIPKNIVVGYLSQKVINDANNTLYDEAIDVFKDQIKREKELELLANKMALEPNNEDLHNEYAKKLNYFEANGGYDYHYLIEMILLKFGFKKEDFNRKISSFSGGERTKMAFAKLLLIKPDLLILDEPTNHLDISTIDWLEDYLKNYPGTILFVSHDRYFINSLANRIFEIENKELNIYKGNYDQYLNEKKLRYELQLKNYNSQQKEIEKLKRFIEYFKPKPRFVARAKDREKKLEHMKIIDKPYEEKNSLKIAFQGDSLKGKKIMLFTNCLFGYDKPLFDEVNLTLFSDDHLAIMGDNGCGKTTILKTIMHQIKLLSGSIDFLRPLNIGYLAQNDFSLDDCSYTLIEYIQNSFENMLEKEIRNHLGKFGFHDDDVFKVVKVLSGGEKMRLILAKLVLNNYDLLLLDEPTNHLDLIAKEALINALESYGGAIILVSHDRYFVDTLANRILYISNHKTYLEEGNYASLKEDLKDLFFSNEVKEKKEKKVITKTKSSGLSKLKCEEKLEILEGKIQELKDAQFLEENYMDSKKMCELETKQKQFEKEYDELLEYYISNFDA